MGVGRAEQEKRGGPVVAVVYQVAQRNILDQLLPLMYLQGVTYPADVDGAAVTAHFAAYAAGAELIWHGCVRLDCKLDAAALAATI